jgi:hypothetical protein
MSLIPYVGLMFIRLCSTSKCIHLTYNMNLCSRERKKEKKTIQLVRGEKRKERENTKRNDS